MKKWLASLKERNLISDFKIADNEVFIQLIKPADKIVVNIDLTNEETDANKKLEEEKRNARQSDRK